MSMDLCSLSPARVAPPQLHLLHLLFRWRSLSPSVLLRDQQHTLLPSAPLLPHLHLRMMHRGKRLLQIGRDTFLLRSLVGQDIHLLIRVWMTTFIFISIFPPYLAYLSYFISFPDSFIGGSSHPSGPAWDSWQGQ
jgi:hypothetical protein